MIEKYKQFIDELNKTLSACFDEQKEFICCGRHCGVCCSQSYYPLSELEFEYVKQGFLKLSEEKQKTVIEKAFNVFIQKIVYLQENPQEPNSKFIYECPFLFDKKCVIYEYRPVICRTHGLISVDENNPEKKIIPYCKETGLNYANVWDETLQAFSEEKAASLGLKQRPKFYNLGYNFLKRQTGLDFGYTGIMYEFIIKTVPDYEKIIENILKESD